MSDIDCPYCGAAQEVCHDDGQGYAEDEKHLQECSDCEKYFVFTTSIIFSYTASIADCLNGSAHKYVPTNTYPVEFTRMRCTDCDDERHPTESEMADIVIRAEALLQEAGE